MREILECSRESCPNKGEWYAVICVPALGDREQRHPLRMIIDVPLCRDHVQSCEIDDFLSSDGRSRIRVALMERGKAMPDFARAWKERGKIGDEHWLAFMHAKSEARPPG